MSTASTDKSDTTRLRRIDPAKLRVGGVLPGTIRALSGRVLIRPGRTLNADDLTLIEDHLKRGIYGDSEWAEEYLADMAKAVQPEKTPPTPDQQTPAQADSEIVPLPVEHLQVGRRLSYALYNRNGALLIPAGVEINKQFLDKLNLQGVFEVHADKGKLRKERQTQATSTEWRIAKHMERLLGELGYQEFKPRPRRTSRPRLELVGLQTEIEHGRAHYAKAVQRVAEISADLVRGKPASISAATEVVSEFMRMVRLDSSLLPAIIKLTEIPGEYLFHHAMNVALLAMTVADGFSLSRVNLLQIGLGALLQDVGMMQVPQELRLAPRSLTPEEYIEIRRHPLYTLDFVNKMEGLSNISKVIVYQSHERADRSGYPSKCQYDKIHPFARLVGTVDVYAAMISNRPYRNARPPYETMEFLLRETKSGRFDPQTMRMLIDSLSLFPIGSLVKLSDGNIAKVLRANPGMHTRPVVIPLSLDGSESRVEIDLSRIDNLRIVQALNPK
ncbi:MAG: hypothetical protein KAV82_00715 [Phycisphaerae bacterium]|nr:hypothetical protein [Phycisphaerae bacterium]